jgi:hypothetical protein
MELKTIEQLYQLELQVYYTTFISLKYISPTFGPTNWKPTQKQ